MAFGVRRLALGVRRVAANHMVVHCNVYLFMSRPSVHDRFHGRVVKAMDLKSIGFSRVGSNPAETELLLVCNLCTIGIPILHSYVQPKNLAK